MLTLFDIKTFGGFGGRLLRKYLKCERCPVCGLQIEEWSYENVEMEVSGGTSSRWPDIFAAGNSVTVHERVVDALTSEKVSGFIAHRVTIKKITKKKLLDRIPPQYYILEPKGTVNLDLNEYGNEKDGHVCPKCFGWVRSPGGKQLHELRRRYVPDLKTWDGSDFVRLGNVKLYWTLCTRKIIDLAGKYKWTNFIFGQYIPQTSIMPKPMELYITYLDPAWFEAVTIRVKAKYPDLFGLTDEEARSLLPPKPHAVPEPPAAIQSEKSEAEKNEERVKKLQNPRFDLIESHFKCSIPQSLKELYENKKEVLRSDFAVKLRLSEEVMEEAGMSKIEVGSYRPIDGTTMESWGEEMENYIEFASDRSEGIYCIDPREEDPEVHILVMDGGDLYPLGIPLSKFLHAPRRNNQ